MEGDSDALRILYVAFEMPRPGGSGTSWALYTTLAFLAERHQVKLACRVRAGIPPSDVDFLKNRAGCVDVIPLAPERDDDWTRAGYLSDWVFRRWQTWPSVQRLLGAASEWAQIVQVENLSFAFNLLGGLTMARVRPRPVVVVRLHDVMSLLAEQQAAYLAPTASRLRRLSPSVFLRALSMRRVAQYRRLERTVYQQTDAVVVFSREDEAFVRTVEPSVRLVHIPMGVELTNIHPNRKFPRKEGQPLVLTFVGSFAWEPNADAAMVLARDILPLWSDLDLRVWIVGADPPSELRQYHDGQRVNVMGYVPDLEAIWRQTDIAVVPVRFGTGVKVKTLDALAHGVPVVTLPAGRRGVGGVSGADFLEASTIEEFAQEVRRLARDPALAGELSANGRQLVEREHSAAMSAGRLESLYRELLRARARR